MAGSTIKIYGALEANTENQIIAYTSSIYDVTRQDYLSNILSHTQAAIDVNPELAGTEAKIVGLGINGVNYRLEDIGFVKLDDDGTHKTVFTLTSAQVKELVKDVAFLETEHGMFVKCGATVGSVVLKKISTSSTSQSTYNILDFYEATLLLATNTLTITNTSIEVYSKSQTDTLLGAKQDTLVSGTNIKTINNTSVLGSGNIDTTPTEATTAQINALFQ